jgi:hypothetical protein
LNSLPAYEPVIENIATAEAMMDVDVTTDVNNLPIDIDSSDSSDSDSDSDVKNHINLTQMESVGCYIAKDADDNAGDADTAGDGSACMEAEFLEYDSNLNSDEDKSTSKDIQESMPEEKPSSKQGTLWLLLGMPIEELVSPPVVFVVVT